MRKYKVMRKLKDYELKALNDLLKNYRTQHRGLDKCKIRECISQYLNYEKNIPLTIVGELLNRHHTTIMNAIKNYNYTKVRYPEYYKSVENKVKELKNNIDKTLKDK